ncbi:threonine ammonia-lyase [Williamsia sterculiae]|uniref:threonine ammonia-lyase n=1 Tax=Williamsia sterculiae TaxID=1344003 RepID=A0A1N7DRM5_9NOCA|nr:threonine ammonia-lyase [Williamsia sterculiae]SIR78474.1 threonine dehydratase [Williamsia sterculiae]
MVITEERIEQALRTLAPVMRRTPMVASRALSDSCGHDVWLKCENLQRTGSFKPRGAYLRIAGLSDEQRARGVVAASAGNHAQGVAWSATTLGIASRVYMPIGASLPKIAATRAYGAEVVLEGEYIDESLTAAHVYAEETGAELIHPFDHEDIVTGQATVGVEICDQMPAVGTVLVPLGGGGLLAGVATAIKLRRPEVRVIGVQAAEAAAWPASLDAGAPVKLATMNTMADGIAVAMPGAVPFAQVSELVDEVVTVSEDAISRALLLLLERAKLIVEPAGATAVAALMEHTDLRLDGQVCAVLSGGNVDPLLLTHITTHGLQAAGRYLTVSVNVPDRPGGLSALLELLRDQGASVVDVIHSRVAGELRLGEVQVTVSLETRGPEHQVALRRALVDAGYLAGE